MIVQKMSSQLIHFAAVSAKPANAILIPLLRQCQPSNRALITALHCSTTYRQCLQWVMHNTQCKIDFINKFLKTAPSPSDDLRWRRRTCKLITGNSFEAAPCRHQLTPLATLKSTLERMPSKGAINQSASKKGGITSPILFANLHAKILTRHVRQTTNAPSL